jgi:hypothetical protein
MGGVTLLIPGNAAMVCTGKVSVYKSVIIRNTCWAVKYLFFVIFVGMMKPRGIGLGGEKTSGIDYMADEDENRRKDERLLNK